MRFLILETTTNWGYMTSGVKSEVMIVDSPQNAAIEIWYQSKNTVEFAHKSYNLYEIDLDNETILRISIPELSFSEPSVEEYSGPDTTTGYYEWKAKHLRLQVPEVPEE